MGKINDKSLILNEIKSHLKYTKDAELAEFLGIKPNTLSNWKTRNTLDYDLIITKCEFVNGDWLLTGKGEMLRENATAMLQESAPIPAQFIEGLSTKDQRIIELQEKQIALLEEKVKGLEKENSNLENEIASLKNKRTPPVKGNHKSTNVEDIHPDRLEGAVERTPEKELK